MLRVAEEFHGSHTGRQRRNNEDSFYARAPLYAVADGMGGAQAGEIASRTAIDTLAEADVSVAPGAVEDRLASLFREANERINALSRSDQSRAGMGTTMTAILAGEDEVTIAHVGDSRAYRLRDGEFERLTDDHSLVSELVRQGRLTEEQAEEHPQGSIITRALGPEPDVEVDTRTWPGRDGDVFLICSDGLTTMLKEGQIGETLRGSPTLRDAGERLIEAANDAGGRDNITVVLVRLEELQGSPVADQATSVGDDALRTSDVQAAVEAERRRPGASATLAPQRDDPTPSSRRLEPVRPTQSAAPAAPPRRRRRGRRALIALVVLLGIGFPLGIGVLTALRAVYFISADEQGYVTVYRGLPYELPLGVDLYQENYTSGVHRDVVPDARVETLLDQSLRSRDDAYDVVAELERGRLEVPER